MNTFNVTIPGFDIAYKTWGNPSNPPLMALHGWLDNANSFAYLAQYLQDDYYVIAPDFPGHGLSSHLAAGCQYHFIDGIFTIIHIMNALKLEKVHMLGHSMGACLASLAAGVAPERFLSLTLIEALGPFSAPAQTACSQLSNYIHAITQEAPKQSKGYASIEKAARARSVKGYVSLDIAHAFCERGLIEREGLFYWRHDYRLIGVSPLKMTETQVLSCLNAITTKTYLILADKGFSFDSDVMQNRIKAIKNIHVELLDGGHHIHMEKPEPIAKIVARSIASR